MSPQRVQRKRAKGWRMPENTVSVCRPGRWGNPFPVVEPWLPEDVVRMFRDLINDGEAWWVTDEGTRWEQRNVWRGSAKERASLNVETIRTELAGKNLACWCPPDQPCHAEVLLVIANTKDWMTAGTEILYWPGVRSEHYTPRRGTVLQDGVKIFGGTACVRIRKQDGGTDYIQLSHIEPAP